MSEQTTYELYKRIALLLDEEDTAEVQKELEELGGRIDKIETEEMDRRFQESREYHAKARAELAKMRSERIAMRKEGPPVISGIRFWEVNGERLPVLHIDLSTPPQAEAAYLVCKVELESLSKTDRGLTLLRLLREDIVLGQTPADHQ